MAQVQPPRVATNWGIPGENEYNDLVLRTIEREWPRDLPPLSPVLVKAIIKVESDFNPKATSRAGARGLMQVGVKEARAMKLPMHPVDARERPEINIPAGVRILAEKVRNVREPERLYGNDWYQGMEQQHRRSGKPMPRVIGELRRAARKAEAALAQSGRRPGENGWRLFLAAYNGGEGTVILAMSFAAEGGRDPGNWESLIAPLGDGPSPLKRAVTRLWGSGAVGKKKFGEVAAFPEKVLGLAAQDPGRNVARR